MHISVCKNVIQQNNKNGWQNPAPTIRVSKNKSAKATLYSNHIGIVDANGNLVAEVISTKTGAPVINCGAKVGIITKHNVVDLENED